MASCWLSNIFGDDSKSNGPAQRDRSTEIKPIYSAISIDYKTVGIPKDFLKVIAPHICLRRFQSTEQGCEDGAAVSPLPRCSFWIGWSSASI
ncbi:hypothetical protein Synpcc7942_1756 [Synechococcus elongatus PCC 7942 = FACHB-805]|uniref:Uncharacterized protein n=1 Tax=Synechococcus elongatus (strain ATCC 33912 / PCC 7942 / FACHB-805) TaxID=1140 RepID=Q31MD3_SYNE7|nr:hypothetical protein Synpcc7942_1756 [Synechococcus elongatus PCC 7942 = FACHB-805]